MDTLRDYNKLHKIISNENGKEFFEMIRESEDLYMFFSINKLNVWHNGLVVCTVTENGIDPMKFKERAEKIGKKELVEKIKNTPKKYQFGVYLENIDDIRKIVKSGKGNQVERINQQEIAQKNRKLNDFQILGLEFAVPQEIIASKPEFDYIAVDTAKNHIYLIEYKCTYKATIESPSNLEKHYLDMKSLSSHEELIKNTIADLWKLEKHSEKSFFDYKIIPSFLFTNFDYEFRTPTRKEKLNALINKMKQDTEIVVWNFDKPDDVDFSKDPIPVKDYKI